MKYSNNFESYWEEHKLFFEENSVKKETAYVIWRAAVSDVMTAIHINISKI